MESTQKIIDNMVDDICYKYNFYKSRMYRDNDRRDYLLLDRCKKRTSKKIHVAIKKQLQYIKRALGYIDMFLDPKYHDKERRHDQKLDRIINHRNERRSHSGCFIVPKFDIDIFKVQLAE